MPDNEIRNTPKYTQNKQNFYKKKKTMYFFVAIK